MRLNPLVYRDINLPDDGLNAARGLWNGLVLGSLIWATAFGLWYIF